jgi:endonuclease YncB( thermonuclease family)
VQARPWHQSDQTLHELQRRHHQVRGAVVSGRLPLSTIYRAALYCTRSSASAGVLGKQQHKIRLDGIDALELKQAFGNRLQQSLSDLAFSRDAGAHSP